MILLYTFEEVFYKHSGSNPKVADRWIVQFCSSTKKMVGKFYLQKDTVT